GADAGAIDRLEENVGAAPPPSDLVRQGLDAPAILARLLAGFPTRVLEEQPLRFQCRCSRERVEAAIVAMGRTELIDVLARARRAPAADRGWRRGARRPVARARAARLRDEGRRASSPASPSAVPHVRARGV